MGKVIFSGLFGLLASAEGFTTFSTFGLDALNLLKSAQWIQATLYISLNLLGTLLSILIGFRFYGLFNPSFLAPCFTQFFMAL